MLLGSFGASFLVHFTLGLQAECDIQVRKGTSATGQPPSPPANFLYFCQTLPASFANIDKALATCGCSIVFAGVTLLHWHHQSCMHHLKRRRSYCVQPSLVVLALMLQGSRVIQRYIDYKKLQRLMKDISGFSATQRLEGGQPMMHIQPKQVQQAICSNTQQATCSFQHCCSVLEFCMFSLVTTSSDAAAAYVFPAETCVMISNLLFYCMKLHVYHCLTAYA